MRTHNQIMSDFQRTASREQRTHHEGGIEPHPKSAYDAPRCVKSTASLCRLGQLVDEGLGPRSGNGAQVFNHFLPGKSDASVGNCERPVELVRLDADLQRHFRINGGIAGPNLLNVSKLFESIGCVANKLTEEHLLVGV